MFRRAGLVAAAVGLAFAPIPPSAVERWYSNGAYPAWQGIATAVSNGVPFAILDGFILAIVLWLAWRARDLGRRAGGWLPSLARYLASLAVLAAALYLAFLGAWGMNYRRVPLRDKLPFDARMISPARAKELALLAAANLNALHDAAHAGRTPSPEAIDPDLARAFADAEGLIGVKPSTRVGRPKRSMLDAYFKAAAVDGMTDPFLLETLVVSDLLPFERPLVVAHEWGHLAGFADESEANFIGWLACVHGTPALQYSGWLFLYGEIARGLTAQDRSDVGARLAEGPREDLGAIAERMRRDVKPIVFAGAWRTYDRYLKANRVEAGTASYAQVVQLVLGTRFSADWRPRRQD